MRPVLPALALCSLALPLAAQQPCRVPTSSNEAKLLYYYAVPLAFSAPVVATPSTPGSITIGGDLTYIPEPDPAIQRTGQGPVRCYSPKDEASNLSPVLPRPRITIALPLGLVIEASYLPPVTVADATPNLLSLAVSRGLLSLPFPVTPVSLRARLHATIGNVRGPITCSPAMLQQADRTQPCFGTNPSEDTYAPNILGGELVAALGRQGGRFGGQLGIGATSLTPEFQVGFTSQDNAVDTSRVEPAERVVRVALLAGAWMQASSRLALGAQIYSVPRDLSVLRAGGSWRVR
jgi:hypothetical protein